MSDNLDNLLDASIEELEDMPEFRAFPAGVHIVQFNFSEKKVNDSPCVELELKARETVELVDEEDTPLKHDESTNLLYQLDNEFGQGKLKKIMQALAPRYSTESIRETMEAASGEEFTIVTKVRSSTKDNETKYYTDIVSIVEE